MGAILAWLTFTSSLANGQLSANFELTTALGEIAV